LNNNIWTDGYLLAIEWEEEAGLRTGVLCGIPLVGKHGRKKFMNDLVTSLGIENILNDL
jgi:hypothetical protein